MKRWPLKETFFWERAPFFRLLLPLIAGILLYGFTAKVFALFASIALVAAIGYSVTAFIRKQGIVIDVVRTLSLHAAIVCIGWLLSYYADVRNDAKWFGHEKANAFIARINNTPAEKERTWKLEIDVLGALNDGKYKPATGEAFVYVYKDAALLNLQEGDTIILPANWQPITTAGNPFEFDYAAYCAHNNIYYQQFLSAKDVVLHAHADAGDLPLLRKAHLWCMQQLENYIHDKPTLGLIQAMLIGDEINMDRELRQAYAETGIIHIVAISGSHITFFFLIITFLLGWIKHKKYHWLKYLAAIPLIWLYVLMAGASPSAVRAAIMFSILSIGFALQRQPNALNYLFAAAFILLCAAPSWLYAVGFQLSFLAVLSLVLFYRYVYAWWSPMNKARRALWSVVAASISAEILIAPLVIYYFHMFPLLFIVANVAASLFMGGVLVAGMLIVLFSKIAVIANFLALITEYGMQWFNKMVFAMQSWNPQSLRYLDISAIELVCLYIVIAALAYYLIYKQAKSLLVSLSAACVFMCLLYIDYWQSNQQRTLVAYNISKANHIELIEGKHYAVALTDSIVNAKNRNYVLKPAHIGFHAWREKQVASKDIFVIGNKTVLLLKQPVSLNAPFAVDYLLVNYPVDPAGLQQIRSDFPSATIVMGNNLNRRETAEIAAIAKSSNIPLHLLSRDGAFVLKSF
jgi:competence protein ComEC